MVSTPPPKQIVSAPPPKQIVSPKAETVRTIEHCTNDGCDFAMLVTPDYVLLSNAKLRKIYNPKWVRSLRVRPEESEVDLRDDILPYVKTIIEDQASESRNKGIPEETIRAQTARWSKPENSTIMFRVSGNSLEPCSYMLSIAETEHLLSILAYRGEIGSWQEEGGDYQPKVPPPLTLPPSVESRRGTSTPRLRGTLTPETPRLVSGIDWYESWLGSGGPRLIEQKFDELAVSHYAGDDIYPTEKDPRKEKPMPLEHVVRLRKGNEVRVLVGRNLSTIATLPSLIEGPGEMPGGNPGLGRRGLTGVVGCYGSVRRHEQEAMERQITSLSGQEVLALVREKAGSLVVVNKKVAEVRIIGTITDKSEIADIVGWELVERSGNNRPEYRLIVRPPGIERRSKSLVYVWNGVLAMVDGNQETARQAIKEHAEKAGLTHDIGVTMAMEHLGIRGWRFAWEFSACRDASIEILGIDEKPGLGVTSSVEILLSASTDPEIITAAMSRLKNESSDYLDALVASIDIEYEAQHSIQMSEPAVPDLKMAVIPLRCNGLQWQRHPRLGEATRSAVPNICRLIKRRGGCGLRDVAKEYEARGATVTIQTATRSEAKGWKDLTQASRKEALEYELSEDQRKVIDTLDGKDEFMVFEVDTQERVDKGLVIFNIDDRTSHLMWNKCRDSLALREVLDSIEIERSTLNKNGFVSFNQVWGIAICGGPWEQLDMYEAHPRAIEQVTKADMKKMTADELDRLMSLDKADVLDMQEHRQSYVLSAERIQANSASLQTLH